MIRAALARHYDRQARAAGAATLDAQQRRDWPAAKRHLAAMHAAHARAARLQPAPRRDEELADLVTPAPRRTRWVFPALALWSAFALAVSFLTT